MMEMVFTLYKTDKPKILINNTFDAIFFSF